MIFDELDLQFLQLVVIDRNVAVAIELVTFDDLVAADLFAGLGVDKTLRKPVSGL